MVIAVFLIFRKLTNLNPFNPVYIYQAEVVPMSIYMMGLKLHKHMRY